MKQSTTLRMVSFKKLATIGGLCVALNACNTIDTGGVGCPDLPSYTAAEQKEAAAEIRRNPNGQLAKMIRDYGKVRKACRITQ